MLTGVINAHRINRGQPPQLTGFGDLCWFTCDPAEDSDLHQVAIFGKLRSMYHLTGRSA